MITEKIKKTSPLVILIIMGIILALCLRIRIKAQDIGSGIGNIAGQFAGKINGTIDGVMNGIKEGAEAGKTDGLSAADTRINIQKRFQEVANLRVMVATVRLKNLHEVGDYYKALYLLKGKLIFAIDLKKAEVTADDVYCYINIPLPDVELYIDEEQKELIAEYQKFWDDGDAESGYNAYINSMREMYKNSKECIANYSDLYEKAKQSALNQVMELASAVSINLIPRVTFREEGVLSNE